MEQPVNVLSFGAGAIGTYIGGSLAMCGHKVVFIEHPATAEELRKRGLSLDLAADPRRWKEGKPPSAAYQPANVVFASSLDEALERGPFDIGLYALKSFDTTAALEMMRPWAADLPPILCLSNGVENEMLLAAVLGADKVIPGTVTSSVGRRAAGDIILERLRGVGVADRHPLSLWLAGLLEAAFLNPRLYLHADGMKWSKMLTNLLANASAAILDMTPAQVFAHPGLYRLEMRMLREALRVMRAQGIKVLDTPRTPVRLLALAARLPGGVARPLMVKAVGGGRGGKMPSFHIDLHAGRGRSEVDSLNGAVVRFGEKMHIPTPVNRVLNETLLKLTRGEIPLTEFSQQPEKLLKRMP
jgi:2-dehydropantoate 2-reductase